MGLRQAGIPIIGILLNHTDTTREEQQAVHRQADPRTQRRAGSGSPPFSTPPALTVERGHHETRKPFNYPGSGADGAGK